MEDGEEPRELETRYGVRQGQDAKNSKNSKNRFYAVENLRTTIVSQTKKYRVQPVRILQKCVGVSGKADARPRILRLHPVSS
jgi:hypothetical protein